MFTTYDEMNETIAGFMGGSMEDEVIYIPEHPTQFAKEGVGFRGYAGSLKYRESWDWLMPVYRKLKNQVSDKCTWGLNGHPVNTWAIRIRDVEVAILDEDTPGKAFSLIYTRIQELKEEQR